jgi:hypothetical protein
MKDNFDFLLRQGEEGSFIDDAGDVVYFNY